MKRVLFRGFSNQNIGNDNKVSAHLNLSYPQKPGRLHPIHSNKNKKTKPRQENETEKHSFHRPSWIHYGKGSLSLEAALVFSMFLIVLTAITSFFHILQLQIKIQTAMGKAAAELAVNYYAAEEIREKLLDKNTLMTELGEDILCYLMSENLVRSMIQDEIGEIPEGGMLDRGTNGISFLGTHYDDENDDIVICVSYRVRIPYFLSLRMRISQNVTHHAWVGESDNYESKENIVYVTQHGEVYHTALSCTYLDLSVLCVDYQQVGNMRNKSGKKYYLCEYCDNKEGEKVFVTGYGERYHFDRNCSGLRRSICSVPISQIGNLRLCSRCKSRGE